jgi:outer membrane protein assembly factor BamB
VELKTGMEKWRTDERFGEYWSLAANGDKLLALDQKGMLYLVKANPAEYELLDKKKVAESESWAHVAVCGDEIYVRDLTGLTVFKWSK